MPQYRYTVVNKESKQLSGTISAPNVDIARKDLQELGFSIVSLEEREQPQEDEKGVIFEFAGRDPHNKTIKGTIRSDDRYSAFKRLIKEYDLEVEYIVNSELGQEEKAEQKKAGIRDLLQKYQEEVREKTDMFHKEKIKNIDRNFEREKALVMRQVDFVIKKVKDALDSFADDLSPQDQQTIKNYVNKILRIKSSTNLEYIKNECKKLLEFLQNAEIFTEKKKNIEQKVKLYADAKKMIGKIDKGKEFGKREDLQDKILKWKKDNLDDKDDVSLQNRILDFFISIFLKVIHEEEDVRNIKKQIKRVNEDIKQFYSIYIKNKSSEFRSQASKSIKKLKERKKELKNELDLIKKNISKEERTESKSSLAHSILKTINGITGWLLFFYLLFYFVSNNILSKQLFFAEDSIPSVFYIFRTGSIKYVLPIVFLLHITTSTKIIFFRKNVYASILLFPLFLIMSIMVVFNF